MTEQDKIHTILVGTDFSEAGGGAVDWAIELARAPRARVIVAHALSPALHPGAAPELVALPPNYAEKVREACLAELDAIAARIRGEHLEAHVHLETAVAAEGLLRWVADFDADLLVAGTRGLTGLRHVLLGSTAEQLVRGAPCPVLCVHPGQAARPRPVGTLLIPTDFSEDAALAVETALRVLGEPRSGQRVVLLHAYHLPVEFTPLAGRIPVGPALVAEACEEAEKRLEPIAHLVRDRGFEVARHAREGYPPTVIEEAAREFDADLIAMGTHGRSGLKHALLGSTAERVVQRAPCPVLTVRRSRE